MHVIIKRLLFAAFLVSTIAAAGQPLAGYSLVRSYGTEHNRIKIDSIFGIPPDTLSNAPRYSLAFHGDQLFQKLSTGWTAIIGAGDIDTTTGSKLDHFLKNNYTDSFNTTYFNTDGGFLDLNVGALPSGGGPVYWYATLDSLKAHKPSDGSVGYTNEYALHNGGGMRYVFFQGSTATGNDMTIITPTAGGTGRWYAQPLNGRFTFRQCGAFPSSDNTTAMNAAELAVRVAGYHFIGVDENSNYKIDPAIGFIPVDSMTLFGMDTITSQITPKTYSTHGKFLIIYNSGSDTLVDFHVKNLRLDYLQKGNFTGGFASGNPIGDTDSHIINITLGRDIYIEGCAIVNGGTQSAVNLVHVINGFVRYNRFDSIACKVLSTVGVADNRNIHFEFNKVRRSGWYERWSVEVDLPQEGDDVAYLGGTLNYLNDNEISEMYGRWFWTEGTIFGYNECKRNKIHGSNKNHLGVSWGNDPLTTTWAKGVQITDNVYDGITFDHFTSADSATVHSVFQPKRFATCLFEFGGMENLYQHDYLSHPHFTVARHMRDSWFDNIINSPNSNTTTDPSGGQIIYQVGTGSGDSVLNTKITGTINFKDGQIFKTYGGGCVVKDLNISVNAKWTGTAFIGEIYPATGGVVPTGININGSTFAGNVSSAFYTGTASPVVMNFTNNVASNIDPASNFLTVASGVAPVINKENTRFSTGVFTTHVLTVNSTAPDAAGNVVVSGGGSTNLDSFRTAQRVTIVNPGGTNSVIDSAKANTVGATGLAGTFTGYNAQVLAGKPKVFNVKTDFGAKGDSTSDDSGPIQAAINAARAAGGGEVFLPNGYYSAKNAILPTVGGNPCNCQLYIPYSPADTAMVITLRGETPGDFEFQGVAGFPAPKKGVIIESSLTTATAGDALMAEVKGPGSGTFTKTNQTDPAIYNITFRTKTTSGTNPLTALNLRYASKVKLDFVKADINQSLADSPDPSGIGSYGIILPEKSNHASVDIGTIRVGGFDIGMQIGEHAVIKDFQNACNNVGLVTINSDHSSSIQTFEGELNKTNIRYDGDLNLVILNYNTEQYDGSLGSKWYNFIEDVHFSSYSAYAAKPTTLTIGSSSVGVSGTAGEYIKFATNDSSRVNMLSRNHMMVKTGVFNRGDVDFRNYTGTFAGDGTTPIRIMNNISAPSGKRKWLEYADGLGNHYFSRLADNGLTAVNHLTFTSDVNATLSDTLIAEKGIHGAGGELAILDLANIHAGVSLSGVPTSTNDINVIKGTSNSTTLGLIASSSSAFNTVNGPFMAFRGNSYSAAATQRGNVYLYAGSPSTPLTGEGIVDIGTAAGSAITVTGSNVIKFKTNTPTVGDAWIATNTDGSGHWASLSSSGTPAGSNTQIQFNNSGAFGGLSGVTTPDGTNTLSINTLQLPGSGSGIGTKIYNNASNPTAALTNLYPASGTNINTSLYLIPKGTGASGDKSDLILFGTDFVADASNFDYSNWRATGTSFDFYSGAVGTGTVRPINIFTGSNTNQLQLKTSGALKFGAYGSGSNTGTVAYNLGVDASGNVIETTSGTTTSGTYTPTLVGSSNVTGTPSVTQATYIQSGNIVTVRVSGLVTPTAIPTITIFTISLPFTTATTTQVGVVSGSVTTQSSTPYYAAAFGGVISGSTVDVRYLADANAGSSNAYSITFQYKTN